MLIDRFITALCVLCLGAAAAAQDLPVIRAATLHLWLAECSKESDFSDSGIEIPMDLVAAEVARQFPGRWTGDFKAGARGVRFWSPEGDANSVIVRERGYYKVRAGEFATRQEAQAAVARLKARIGGSPFVVAEP